MMFAQKTNESKTKANDYKAKPVSTTAKVATRNTTELSRNDYQRDREREKERERRRREKQRQYEEDSVRKSGQGSERRKKERKIQAEPISRSSRFVVINSTSVISDSKLRDTRYDKEMFYPTKGTTTARPYNPNIEYKQSR